MSALGLLLLDAGGAAVLEASIDAAGRFLDAGCAALPGVKVCVIAKNLRMAGKLKLSTTAELASWSIKPGGGLSAKRSPRLAVGTRGKCFQHTRTSKIPGISASNSLGC